MARKKLPWISRAIHWATCKSSRGTGKLANSGLEDSLTAFEQGVVPGPVMPNRQLSQAEQKVPNCWLEAARQTWDYRAL